MTFSNQTNRTSAVGSGGVSQVVPFVFPIAATSDLKVYQRITATGVETTLTETTNYTVTISGDAGGTVTTVTAVAVTAEIHVVRDTPNTQNLDLEQGGAFNAENVEDALDKGVKLGIENKDVLTRAMRIPQTDAVSINMEMPSSLDRGGKYLTFDANGEPAVTEEKTTGTATISAFGETLVDDASAAAAQATLRLKDASADLSLNTLQVGAQVAAITLANLHIDTLTENGRLKNVMHPDFGAVGDGATDDVAGIRLAVAACSAGDILYFPPGFTFKITEGITIDTGITVWGYGATLYMDGQSGRSNTIPTISAAYDAMLLVWNGDEGQDVMTYTSGTPAIEAAAKIPDFNIYGLTLKNSSGLGGASTGALGSGIALFGVTKGMVKDCQFEDFGSPMIHCRCDEVLITSNTFTDGEGDCIAGLLMNSTVTNNKFEDCDFGYEGELWYSAIAGNYMKANSRCTVGVWVTNGGNDVDIWADITNNVIEGYYDNKIQATESGTPDHTNFKRVNISNNTCVGRIFSTGGNGVTIEATGGRWTVANNHFDDRDTSGNVGSFILVTGTDTTGKYVIKGNTCNLTTSYPVNFIQIPDIAIATIISGNTSIHDSGTAFRETSGTVYQKAIRVGAFDSSDRIIENNYINQTRRLVDTSGNTVVYVADHEELYFNASVKSITDLYANGFFVVYNLGAATITLTDNDAKIEATGDADIVLTTGDFAGFVAVGTTGKVKQVF